MKILIFGKGNIGSRMANAWPDAVLSDARIEDKAAVLKAIDEYKPDTIVNAAGKTGKPNVDWCEAHQKETYESNVIGPLALASACQEKGVHLIHLASGCIFYGPSPDPRGWREDDFANPEAFYSRTKYAADLVLSRLPNVAIARLRMPIDSIPNSRNLIDKLASYKQVIDVENSVTVVDDLLMAVYALAEKKAAGVFHLVNPGTMRHRDLLNLYHEYVDPSHTCEWISSEDLVTKGLAVRTRSNCILQSPRLEALGIRMQPIQEALRDTMKKYALQIQIQRRATFQTIPETVSTIGSGSESFSSQPFNFLRNKKREMKGVILAGGRGTRLAPLTNVTNKHLLPILNKQMVLYPLQTLLDAGIKDILLVTGPEFAGQFVNLLGSGVNYGCHLTYRIQDEAGGIAHALALAEDFVGDDNAAVILGDNIFDENLSKAIQSFQSGAMVFYKYMERPEQFGVLEVDASGNVLSIEEKPKQPKSHLAQLGLYLYDSSVFDIIKKLKPSARGELEITDVNNEYLRQGKLIASPIRGMWFDAGTFPDFKRAADYFATKENIR
ncbi:MAG TPA: sugar phosphate nucleotidyltransferase [Patescibacteria group bacterium]|nr:sugar phosphate nucleotidyltransferase [Patescibacteria group bacterium]